MPELILGPLLRYVGETEATVWVETGAACEVSILGRRERTFRVDGHHYALVIIDGLEPATTYDYDVALDGHPVWPAAGSGEPRPRIRTLAPDSPLVIAFGSCRVAAPHGPRYEATLGKDALIALAERLRKLEPAEWPALLMLLGDQVYADDVSPEVEEFIRARRSTAGEHGGEVADFEEYTRLYLESWSDPQVRRLLASLPTAMIFDDHDVHDDWNTSHAWRATVSSEPWWRERIVGAFVSYWLYQHLGNLSAAELRADELFARVRASDDAAGLLREFALRADAEPLTARWSYSRDLGTTRLVTIDSRAARVLEPGARDMLDAAEWRWLEGQLGGGVDHLVVATSLPVLLGGSMHDLEAWNEAVAAGAWGRRAAGFAERVRQELDLEHWAAFRRGFGRLASNLESVVRGHRGPPPASVVLLSGDVHHGYVADATVGGEAGVLFQLVSSPLRHPLGRREQRAIRIALSRPVTLAARALARAARAGRPPLRWRLTAGPWFENQVATLTLDGRTARLAVDVVRPAPEGGSMVRVLDRSLVPVQAPTVAS